jgi:hypothetical protein
MGEITTEAAEVFRDYVSDGVPASGAHEPVKPDIRSLFGTIDTRINLAGSSGAYIVKGTLAQLDADLNHAADTYGLVVADNSSPPANGYYKKSGSSGSGSWSYVGPDRIGDEAVTRAAADTSLTTRLSTEESARGSSDTSLTTRVSTETVTRTSADTSLTTRLSTEEVTRGAAQPYRTPPASTDALAKILEIEIYESVGGVAVTLPTNFGVREMGRDATSGGRFRVRFATFDGASTYTQEIREGASTLNDGSAITHNGTYLTAAATLAGQQWIDLYTITTNLGPAIGTKIGRALIDFGTGAVFGTYAGSITSAVGRLYENRLQTGARFDNDVQEQIPANSAVDYLARSQSPLITLPRPNASAAALGVLRCTNITIDPTYPLGSSKVVLRWCGLRSSDAKFWAKLATFDGTSTYTDLCTTGGNAAITATGYTGLYTFNLTALSGNTLSIAAGTVIGTIEVDFGALTSFGSYGSNITYAEGGLVNSRIQFNSGDVTAVNALARVQALAVAASPAFLTTATDTYIRPIVSDIYIEGGDAGERYCLNYEVLDLGSGNGRIRFTVYDTIAGIDVCTRVVSGTKAALVADTRKTLVLFQNDMAGFTGITATIWVNWANITTWSGLITTYTTMAATGIRADRTITPSEMRARFKRGPEPKTLLTVGAGTVTATHFNTVLAAVQSLYDPAYTITRSGPFPMSDKCSFSNQVVVRVIDDAYSEQITLVSPGGSDQSPLVLPPWITLDLPQDALIYSNEASNTGPTIEAPFPFRIRGGTVDCQGSGYAIHIDGVNGTAKRATVGRLILRYPLVSIMEEMTIKGGATQDTWTIGTGLSNGQDFIVDRCRVVMRAASVTGIGIHDSPSTTDAGEITITDTYVNDVAIGAAYGIQLLKSSARTVQHRVTVRNTNTGSLGVGNSGGGASGYIRNGKIDSGITITGTLDV